MKKLASLVVLMLLLSGCRADMEQAWSRDVLRRHDFTERYEAMSQPESLQIVEAANILEIDRMAALTHKYLDLMAVAYREHDVAEFQTLRMKFVKYMMELEVAFATGIRPKTSEEIARSEVSP